MMRVIAGNITRSYLVAIISAIYDGSFLRSGTPFLGSEVRADNSACMRPQNRSGSLRLAISSRKAANHGSTLHFAYIGRNHVPLDCDSAIFKQSSSLNGLKIAFFELSIKSSMLKVKSWYNLMETDSLPANKSSFSLPVSLVTSTTSPVPRAPYFPFRRTRARAVVGLSPFSSRLGACFLETCFGPVGTSSREVDGIVGALTNLFLGGMVDVQDKRVELLRQPPRAG